MVIPLDLPFRLLVLSFAVSRMWVVPVLERPAIGPMILSRVARLPRPPTGPFSTSYVIYHEKMCHLQVMAL